MVIMIKFYLRNIDSDSSNDNNNHYSNGKNNMILVK